VTEKNTSLPCIFLMGPTASGKTDLAVQLVQQFPIDIISVDSAMVYKEMDIGTAKPDADILAIAPHRLIDICDPKDAYSAAQFCQDAHHEIKQIHTNGRIPLLVGGTGLYFRSLQQGLSDLPSANPDIRQKLEEEAEKIGWAGLHKRLQMVDPQAATRINSNDAQRIQRALEIYEMTGINISTWYEKSQQQAWGYPTIKLVVAPADRKILHERIAQRFHLMLEQGVIEEVERLYQRKDLSLALPALRAVGYRQIWHYLEGEWDKTTMIEKGIIATRQLAKRQLTWLRGEKETHWFDSQQANLFEQVTTHLNL